jgi:hypothetical protein
VGVGESHYRVRLGGLGLGVEIADVREAAGIVVYHNLQLKDALRSGSDLAVRTTALGAVPEIVSAAVPMDSGLVPDFRAQWALVGEVHLVNGVCSNS